MRTTLACAIVAIGTLISGCTKPQVSVSTLVPGSSEPLPAKTTLHMDVDFTPEERADADSAADTWSKQTGGQAKIDLVYDLDFNDPIGLVRLQDANVVVRRESWMEAVKEADSETNCHGCVLGWMNAGGLHNPWGYQIHGAFVVDRINPSDLRQVMLHEFGHALGVPHVQAVQGIMYPIAVHGKLACLRRVDITAFCSVNACDSRKTYPCE